MFLSARKWYLPLMSFCLLLAACEKPAPFKVKDRSPRADADAPFDPPNTYPEWAYDQPQYVRPAQELTPEPKAKPGDPLHYFTKEKVVLIRQPSGYTPEETPRVAIWWSDNNGFHWQKAGYFGRQQSYFAFEVQEDGDYGVRFVGPGQEQSVHATAYPERVYHVDTVFPEVEVTIEPEQTWYNVGQSVTVSWHADDYHLIENPVNVTALMDFSADESKPIEIQKNLSKEGSLTWTIPPEALNHEVRFRVDALDRANNMGIAYSHALQIVSEPVEAGESKPKEKVEEQVSLKKADISKAFAESRPQQEASAASPARGVEPVVIDQVAVKAPPKPAAVEEIIEEDVQPSGSEQQSLASNGSSSSKPRPLPYASNIARQAEKKPSRTIVAISPDSPEESTATEYNLTPPGEPSTEIREVTPAESGGFTPIEPIDKDGGGAASGAKPAGEPVSVKTETGAKCDDDELALMALRSGPPNDLTHGNRLMIPMPATIPQGDSTERVAVAHPWRVLGRAMDTTIRTVWMLPQARFMDLNPALRSLFASDSKTRPVGEPAKTESSFAGLPPDAANQDPTP